MQKSIDEVFEDTLNSFLSEALEAMLGPKVRDEVYSLLGRRGIGIRNVPSQFDDVVNILDETFGALGAKVIVYKAGRSCTESILNPSTSPSGEPYATSC
jgi:hypothetical protein